MSSPKAESTPSEIQSRIRALCQAGETRAAVNLALRTHGPEVLGLLCTLLGDTAEADEVFSLFCEHVWKGLPSFQWRSSLRTWLYVLARNTYVRHRTRASRQLLAQSQPLDSEVANLVADIRHSTASVVRTERQEQVMRLRSSLSPEEQMLLTLRLDKQMDWTDIAQVLEPEAADPQRAASALRKRFQRLKERLRELVAQPGAGPKAS